MPVADAQKTVWKDPLTGETFVIDNRTGNSYPQNTHFTANPDGSTEASSKRRTLPTPQLTTEANNNNTSDTPNWLREALQVCFVPTSDVGLHH